MRDNDQTREQLVAEVQDLRRRLQDLENAEGELCRTEEALRETERSFAELAETLPQVVFEMSKDGRLTFVNQNGLRAFGYTEEDLKAGLYGLQVLVPDDRPRAVENLTRILKGEVISGNEYRVLRKDGSSFPVIVHNSPIRKKGKPAGLRGIMFDITERKRVEEELRLSETKYRVLVEQASDGILITDKDGNHLEVNTRACEMLGYSREELMKRKSGQNIHPDDLAALPLQIPRLKPGEMINIERRLVRKDGTVFNADVSGKLLEDGRLQAIIRDITDRKLAEEALRASEERFSIAFQASPDPIILSTLAEGRYIDVNESFLRTTGYTRDEVIGRTSIEMNIWVPEDRVNFVKLLVEQEHIRGWESKFRKKSGEIGLASMSAEIIELRGDKCILAIASDITERKRAEEALREQERNYRHLFERNLAGVYRTTLDGHFLDCNDSLARTMGYESREDLLSHTAWDLYQHSADRQAFISQLRQHGTLTNFEYEMRRKDGSSVWILENVSLTENGAEGILQGTVIDITERKHAEKALRESETKFRAVAEQTPCAIFLYQDSRFLYANPALEKMTGYTRRELLEMHEVITPLLHPDFINPTHQRELATQQSEQFAPEVEIKIIRKDKTERWLDLTTQPVSYNGRPALLGTAYDITERKLAEEALAAEKERLSVTLRSIDDGVIATDTEGRIVLMNQLAEQLLACTQESATGRPLTEIFRVIDEKTRLACPSPVDVVLRTQETMTTTASRLLVAKDGRERVITESAAPIRDGDGKIIGLVLAFRDITERRRLEAEIQKSGKLESIGVLAGGIAHDFNNILTGILGNISLAKLYIAQDERSFKRLSEAEQACLRAKELTQQLLTFSRGGAPIKKTASIAGLLRESATFALTGSTISCDFELPDELWHVEVDPGQMSQVVHNLVLNAQQSMGESGTITIGAANKSINGENTSHLPLQPGPYVEISIADRGAGIPPEHLGKIFDPYFTTKPSGSGLGLTTSYSIVKNHGGYLTVDSQLGLGTTLQIYLPASEDEIDESSGVPDQPRCGKGRVLVMDDEQIIREMAGELLAFFGYNAAFAKDGAEAIEMYTEAKDSDQPFDIVVMDLTVPGGMGGKETIRHLREIDPNVKAIVSSGYSNDPVMADFRQYGFNGVVAKPYKLEEFGEVLLNVLHG